MKKETKIINAITINDSNTKNDNHKAHASKHLSRLLKKTTAITLLLVLLFTFTACSGSQGDNDADTATTLDKDSLVVVMGVNSEPEAGFDPAYGWGAGEHVHEPLIQSTLTVTNTDLEIEYDLATDVSVSEDGMLWTVSIRDDAYFTDGEKLTADDVAFTYNTVKDLSTVNDFTMLDYAEAYDDTTVLFHMTKPYSIFPYSMAIVGIIPEHCYDANYGQQPIGSGRYIMKQWDKGQQVIFEANPDYYGETPIIKKVTILFMTEDAAFAAVKAGQADLAYTAATYAGSNIPGYSLLSVKSVDNRGLNLPAVAKDGSLGNDITKDIAIRQAVNIGIDRNLLIQNVLDGHGSPAYSVCDNLPWYSDVNEVDYDIDNALKILDEAGWIVGPDGIREKDGIKAKLNILYPTNDSVRQAIAAETCNQLRTLGFDMSYEGVGWDTAYDRAQNEIMTWGWGAHTPMEVYNIYHSKAGSYAEYSPYLNEKADTLMDEALSCSDLEESYTLWQAAQDEIANDMPWVWLVNIDHLYFSRDGLHVADQKIHPHGHGWSIVNNVDKWYWE